MDDGNSVTTKLLTLLNVSATKVGKRKRTYEEDLVPSAKLNRRKSASFADTTPQQDDEKEGADAPEDVDMDGGGKVVEEAEGAEDEEDESPANAYEQHFGNNSAVLSESARNAVDSRSWKAINEKLGSLGQATVSIPQPSEAKTSLPIPDILDRLKTPFADRQIKSSPILTFCRETAQLQKDLLSALSTRRDLYLTYTPLDTRKPVREAITLHALNHVTKKRRRVLKNNDRLSHAQKATPNDLPEDVQDQGFTRPSVLILLPFRSSAANWFHALASHTPPPQYQIENQSRFLSEYGLPPGAVDKLASAEPGTYPPDHVETVRMFTEFYGCDIVIASPLGLRRSIEKEKHADYLSSVEILIIDQVDVLTMQNWDHVKFVLSHTNKLPKESHDTDFSRIKSWYLDGHAAYLRQSIMLTAYETPEIRALYNSFTNVAGKIRTEKMCQPVPVPEGIEQSLVHFDCTSPQDEPDKRFHHFTTQLLPTILKSAVQSTNTVVFIPSSFDFIRVHNYFRKQARVSFAIISEYSTNQDISRARQAFFKGTKSFLLVSERFHFYKRYKIRGIRNLVFYGPPDHPQFFTEYLSYPFLDDDVDASDVTCKVLYSKFDWLRLERIVGTEAGLQLIKGA
ncbi:U3 small nucleolar RNA-associated protein 25 [Leucoagaricus sp. SymC.cos]|nr:U3 small nucleolar RNA-associated protein 25 [Leucoagaricus sp. SymC.cos]